MEISGQGALEARGLNCSSWGHTCPFETGLVKDMKVQLPSTFCAEACGYQGHPHILGLEEKGGSRADLNSHLERMQSLEFLSIYLEPHTHLDFQSICGTGCGLLAPFILLIEFTVCLYSFFHLAFVLLG
jgi:hypothetical protein